LYGSETSDQTTSAGASIVRRRLILGIRYPEDAKTKSGEDAGRSTKRAY
jgi:hypothetical protein